MNYIFSSHSPGNPQKNPKNTSFKILKILFCHKKKLYHYKVISRKFWIQFETAAKVRSTLMFLDTWQELQINVCNHPNHPDNLTSEFLLNQRKST
jgi:hypothetical protein